MSRNEIRLRRTISPGQIARHRNYKKLMARHSRYIKMKRSVIALVYVLILVLMILLYMLVKRSETQKQMKNGNARTLLETGSDTVATNSVSYTDEIAHKNKKVIE
jgi:hypothetical protein